VLPFESFGREGDDGFCDGLTEEIINAVAQIEGIRVTARTSAFAFKHRCQDIRSIGEALNAGVVVEGSVRREGDRMRITAQLIDIGNGYHLWSRRFDHEMTGTFAIQDDVARAVAEVVRFQFGQPQGIEAEDGVENWYEPRAGLSLSKRTR
jgi:TolB-like protein